MLSSFRRALAAMRFDPTVRPARTLCRPSRAFASVMLLGRRTSHAGARGALAEPSVLSWRVANYSAPSPNTDWSSGFARNPSVTRRARFTAARRPASFHAPVLEVGDAGRLDGPDLLELHLRVPEVVEEATAVAEQHGNDVELELVQQSCCQVLLSDLGAAPKHDVLAAGGVPCPVERGL